jgi:Formyl transferase
MGEHPLRLVVFVDPNLAASVAMLAGCLRTAAARQDIEVVAIVDTARQPASPLRLPRALAGWTLREICNLNTGARPEHPPLFTSCDSLARRRRVRVLRPRDRGVNDPDFIATIERLRPDATIALMVSAIFRSPLLAACRLPLNYHNALLPRYRGVGATGWSIYEGDAESGFSFHQMIEQVDGGPILLQGSLPIGPRASAAPLERAKTALASSRLNELFDRLVGGSTGATEQHGPGSSYNRAALREIRTVARPQELTLAELELRLRAFETLELTLDGGSSWSTTALRRARPRARKNPLAFTTADGVPVQASRLNHLPPALYRPLRPIIKAA